MRIRPDTDPHVLDLILINKEAMSKILITYTAALGSSDHTCHLNCSATRKREKHTKGYMKANFN